METKITNLKKKSFIYVVLFFSFYGRLFVKADITHTNEQLIMAVNNEVDTLHPYLTHLILGHFVINFAYHQLIYLDSEGQYRPLLVEKIPNFEDKSLRLLKRSKKEQPEYELEADWVLKENLKWGDGNKITCADIKFALEVAQNNFISTPTKEAFSNIKEIIFNEKEINKCVVRYKKAKIDFFVDTPSPLPKHLENEIYQKNKFINQGYEKNTLYNVNPINSGLWNGPYLIREYKLGSHIVLERNDNFYGEKAKIKKIIIKVFKDSGSIEANLLSKNINMTTRFGLSIDQALGIENKLKAEKNAVHKVTYNESNTFLHLAINMDNPILSDLNIRKALSFGFNKEDLIRYLLHGKAKATDSFKLKTMKLVKKQHLLSSEKNRIQIKDLKKEARAILDKTGWKLAKDNWRYKNGKKLSFQITTTSGNKTNETIVTYIQHQLSEIGIDLQIKLETLKFLFGEKLPKGTYDLAFFSFTFLPEYSWKEVFSSESIPNKENLWSGYNYSRFKNKDVDNLVKKIDLELNQKTKDELFVKLIGIYQEQIPSIPLFFRFENSVIPINLKNYEINPYAPFESINANYWSLE